MTALDQQLDRIAARYRSGMIGSQHAHLRVSQILTESGTEPSAWDCVVALAEAVQRVMDRAVSTRRP